MAPGSWARNQRIVALLAWFVIVVAVEGAVMLLATTDPHGLTVAPTIGGENLDRVEPLFGAAWTGDNAIAWSADGRLVALVGGPMIDILDSASGREVRSWLLPGYADAVAWSPDGTYIAVTTLDGANGPIRITVYSDQGSERSSWVAHDDYGAEGLAWSPDGTRLLSAAGGRSGQFAIWETGTWRPILQKDGAWTTGSSASWSPDGTRFALGGASVAVYRASTGDELWNDSTGDWGRAAWSPREDLIAVGTSSARLRFYGANGTIVANISAPTTDFFGTRMSWSPDGTLLAIAANDGIRILGVDPPMVLRVLSFPIGLFHGGVSLPGNETLDKSVAWSPRGNALAATGMTSHPSFRMWGIRSSPIGTALLGLGAAWVLGLGIALGNDLRFAFRHPGDVARTWGRADPSFLIGRALFGVAIGISVVIGLTGDYVSRISTLQPIPSFSWYGVTGLLSVAFAVPAAFVAARAFRRIAWKEAILRARTQHALGVFGTILLPFLVALGAIPIIQAMVLSSGPPLVDANAALAAPFAMGAVLALGALVSARIARGFPGVGHARAVVGLAASVVASAAVFVGLVLVLVAALNLLQIQPLGDIQRYGITLVFAFGLFPLAVVLGAIAIAAATGLLPTVARIIWPGYARFHGERVMALEARKAVMSQVERQPGIHFRDLLRLSRLGSGTVHYHLYVLEREGFITCRRDGVVKRFYPVLHGTPNTATSA